MTTKLSSEQELSLIIERRSVKYIRVLFRHPIMRIALFCGVAVASGLMIQLCHILGLWLFHKPQPNDEQTCYFSEVSGAAGVVAALALMRRLGDRDISWRAWFAPRGALRPVLAGLGLGVASAAIRASVLYCCGLYRIVHVQRPAHVWEDPTFLVLTAFMEETAFRGYVFRKIEAAAGSWQALLISSFLFGLIHLTNYEATWGIRAEGTLDAFIGGLLLGSAYLLTRRLWLPISLHFMWDYSADVFFGPGTFGTEWLVTSLRAREGLLNAGYWLQQAFNVITTVVILMLVVRRERRRLEAASPNGAGSMSPSVLPSGQR
jgi:membrane protease YdiL (CAAX protease family)